MSNKQDPKIQEKEAKLAAKKALKEKQARIKSSKSKKANAENIFVRIAKAIKRFFKDFRGTVKKIIWPDGQTVFKSTLVVLAVVLVVGSGIWISDLVLSRAIGFVGNKAATMQSEQTTEDSEEKQDDEDKTKQDESKPTDEVTSSTEATSDEDNEGSDS